MLDGAEESFDARRSVTKSASCCHAYCLAYVIGESGVIDTSDGGCGNGRTEAIESCFASMSEAMSAHAAALAAAQEAKALEDARSKLTPLRVALTTLWKTQSQMDRLGQGIEAEGGEGAESAEALARETIEQLKCSG